MVDLGDLGLGATPPPGRLLGERRLRPVLRALILGAERLAQLLPKRLRVEAFNQRGGARFLLDLVGVFLPGVAELVEHALGGLGRRPDARNGGVVVRSDVAVRLAAADLQAAVREIGARQIVVVTRVEAAVRRLVVTVGADLPGAQTAVISNSELPIVVGLDQLAPAGLALPLDAAGFARIGDGRLWVFARK